MKSFFDYKNSNLNSGVVLVLLALDVSQLAAESMQNGFRCTGVPLFAA
jgi:hypothetical protein